jgi:hypothetical protein
MHSANVYYEVPPRIAKRGVGLGCQRVAQVNSDLISRDKERKPQTVRYRALA